MKGFCDFQIQTVYSDGQLTPRAIVRLAKRYDVRTLAITDHDSVGGIDEAMQEGRRCGVVVIPGIELYSTFRGKELHILGYNLRHTDARFVRFLTKIQAEHREWLRVVTAKLLRCGWTVRLQTLLASPSQLMGYQEIFRELLAHPKNRRRMRKEFGDASPDLFLFINRYFVPGMPAYAPQPEKRISTVKAISLIRAAHGKAVLAHPGQQLQFTDDALILALKQKGLQGIEAITPHHTWHQILHYQWLAKKWKLFVTAGSDFHEVLDASYITRNRWDYFRIHLTRLPWQRR